MFNTTMAIFQVAGIPADKIFWRGWIPWYEGESIRGLPSRTSGRPPRGGFAKTGQTRTWGGEGGYRYSDVRKWKKLRNQSFSLFPSNGISTCFFLLTNESVSLHRGLHLAICELIVINIITRHLRHTQPDVQWSPHTDAVECPLCSSCWDILRFFTDD